MIRIDHNQHEQEAGKKRYRTDVRGGGGYAQGAGVVGVVVDRVSVFCHFDGPEIELIQHVKDDGTIKIKDMTTTAARTQALSTQESKRKQGNEK